MKTPPPSPSRRLIWLLLAPTLGPGVPASLPAADAARPNVLFILADDLRVEWADEGSPALTPNLDRLAARSLRFDRAYCQQALCNPSRSSLLTGLRPETLRLDTNGVHFRERRPDIVTLPQYFKAHGYETRGIGKIFHNWHTREHGDRRSWSAPEFLHYAHHGADTAQVPEPSPSHARHAVWNYGGMPICEARDVPDDAYYDGRVATEAVRVLAEPRSQPLFLAVGFWKPHAPFNAPKKYWDLYDPARLPAADASRPDGAPAMAFHEGPELIVPRGSPEPLTPEQVAEMRHGYLAALSYLDAQLGRVLAALEASGEADRTLIVFTSDHGFHLGEHALWGKTSNFERDARVPLLIALPGAKDSKATRALAELVDLYPTLAELCRLPPPPEVDGVSLAPILHDPTQSVKPAAFTQHPRPSHYDRFPAGVPTSVGYSVRTASVRYTEWRAAPSGEIVGRELYPDAELPGAPVNRVDDHRFISAQTEATDLLRAQFPVSLPPAAPSR